MLSRDCFTSASNSVGIFPFRVLTSLAGNVQRSIQENSRTVISIRLGALGTNDFLLRTEGQACAERNHNQRCTKPFSHRSLSFSAVTKAGPFLLCTMESSINDIHLLVSRQPYEVHC